MDRNINKIKYILISSLLLALSIVLGYVDNVSPFFILNIHVKLGIANIVSFIGMHIIGFFPMFLLSTLRVIILSILNGNYLNFIMSITGCIISHVFMIVMVVVSNNLNIQLKNIKYIFIIFVNVFSSILHNCSQIFALSVLIKTTRVFYLIFPFIFISIVTGLFTGLISNILLNKIKIYIVCCVKNRFLEDL